jgi:acyl-[acyl-carrier-protein]-phospholipid O-acyltransferase/long-chain-fatty-acid--[acyl-carrier-protein] ligase
MQDMPIGQDGLVLIGGTQVMQGYLNDPLKTAAAIVHLDGRRWYKSADIGHLDEDGFLTIAGPWNGPQVDAQR